MDDGRSDMVHDVCEERLARNGVPEYGEDVEEVDPLRSERSVKRGTNVEWYGYACTFLGKSGYSFKRLRMSAMSAIREQIRKVRSGFKSLVTPLETPAGGANREPLCHLQFRHRDLDSILDQ